MTPIHLQDCRKHWEDGLTFVASRMVNEQTLLVVLKDRFGSFDCHRYFSIEDSWECLVDRRGITSEAAIQYALEWDRY